MSMIFWMKANERESWLNDGLAHSQSDNKEDSAEFYTQKFDRSADWMQACALMRFLPF